MDIGPPELIIALVIVLLLFGGKKLPEIARGLGRAQHEFREGMHGDAPANESPTAPATSTSTPTEAPEAPAVGVNPEKSSTAE